MKLLSLTEISTKAQGAFKRFPITLIWAVLGTIFTIYVIGEPQNQDFQRTNIILTFIVGVSWNEKLSTAMN